MNEISLHDVPVLAVFYVTRKGRTKYRRLPDSNVMESDMGQYHPATIYRWIREDWKGGIKSHHSWSGNVPRVWVDDDE